VTVKILNVSDAEPQRFILCVHSDSERLENLRAELEEIAPPEYRVLPVGSATRGLEVIHDLETNGNQVDIVISDIGDPELPGDRFLEIVNTRFPQTRKVLLTDQENIDAAVYSINNADLDRFLAQPLSRDDLRLTVLSLLRLCRLRADNADLLTALRDQNLRLEDMLDSLGAAHEEIESAYVQTMQALATALEAKDHYTSGHSKRVSRFAYLLARRLGLPRDKCEDIRNGALMHESSRSRPTRSSGPRSWSR
jgi:response regulator RpfG family c-di-GMP phosphodiesterase